jgi:protein phosphatase-4 regulatory subunit 3
MILTSEQDESKIHVESEDEPERLLLETRISKDDGYQKQQGTYNTVG